MLSFFLKCSEKSSLFIPSSLWVDHWRKPKEGLNFTLEFLQWKTEMVPWTWESGRKRQLSIEEITGLLAVELPPHCRIGIFEVILFRFQGYENIQMT